ncbi:FAD-linked oxidase C-terminal domain-containing protein [uncultured Bartonella sp.]|uniref:FAD-binding oxidoreductase n=1 Tax=uncultured Bartonella sp. TaxID=104108 RepID=UPI002603F09F|nr:FAD-linked oxidase C-terminal domain-containing protein [uncultured Bartonella sp.]
MAKHRDEATINRVCEELKTAFGERFSTNRSVRESHAHNITALAHQNPDGVLFVMSKDDVVTAVKICARYKMPIIPFGAGSSIEGQLNAPNGGISFDFTKMDQVISFSPEDMTITVQPGITREVLNSWLRDSGLFFPIDPGANASIGGMASTRASGTNAVRYGTMKDAVLCAEAVMANGQLIHTASRAKKSSAGYDLTTLLVGSEGTLGVFTEITLRLHPLPEVVSSGACTFATVTDACNAVIESIQCAIPFARVELLDEFMVKACNAYSGLKLDPRPTLCVEFHGDKSSVAAQVALFGEIAANHGSTDFQHSTDPDKRADLWKARHNAFWAAQASLPDCDVFSTDACVPISKLADCVSETQKDLQQHHLIGPMIGHVGDGNFHVLLGYHKGNKEEENKVYQFSERLSERAIAMGGTCTGEHGIGQRKAKYLRMELDGAVDFMWAIKKALDPDNIFNPGKYGFADY